MVRWKWASLGVAVWLGAVGCGSQTEANEGPPVDVPPEEETPVDVEPSPGPGPSRDPEVEPPPPPQEASCPPLDLGRTPDEGLVEDRPPELFCELSPDACDALRPGHARRSIPRPCRVWDTTPYSSADYQLEHDALGRLDSFLTFPDWYEGFKYDACHRFVAHYKMPAGSMANYDDIWTRAADGQLLRWEHGHFNSIAEMVMERDARGWLLGATTTWSYSGSSHTTLTQRYTLDAQGRILAAEGMSPDPEKGLQFREERRYDAAGALTEVVRRGPTGALLGLKGFSEGRRVRSVDAQGTEKRWSYGPDGRLERYEVGPHVDGDEGAYRPRVMEYRYGEDGRLLRILRTTQGSKDGAFGETRTVSEYRYAEDGRILRREDRDVSSGRITTTYEYDYVCEPDGR
ncbi:MULTISPECIES: hypothetical protein [unclassified Corallococcus]|uniref:hypothetical protein n=1 Tax=unclassified Corallococcus TaxID=2685029 RepID=UPI001A8D9BF7|nr:MULTISPECIES: hypothetical protein [unclassified Corallococcus]MBN9686747.1 hypothetical protein [Corallococcus sp. NCSPR001]WAS81838.1 hypothetical protein O0N60_21125 [Corallococcus sp. NCRR]